MAAETSLRCRITRRVRRASAAAAAVLSIAGGLVALPAQHAFAGGSFVADINAARAAHGLRPLAVSSDLSSIASSWARHMAKQGNISHNPNLTSVVPNWQVVGENVGLGPDEPSIHQAFMNSAPHRANILDTSYTQVGVGTAYDSDGTLYVTEDFRKPMSGGSSSGGSSTAPPTRHPAPPATHPATQPATHPATESAATTAKPAGTPTHPAARRPSAEALLRARLVKATKLAAKNHPADPVAGALGYAKVMSTLAG